MENSWWKESKGFYTEWYLELVKDLLTPERTEREIDFILSVTGLTIPAQILDAGCGNGRHTLAFARRGFTVTGVDDNALFLKDGQEKARRLKLTADFLKKDLRHLDFHLEFDLTVNLFTSLGFFSSDTEHQQIITCMANGLKKSGWLFIELVNGDWLRQNLQAESVFIHSDGSKTVSQRHLESEGKYIREFRRRVYGDITRKEINNRLRIFSSTEITQMLQQANLDIIDTFGDYSQMSPLRANSPQMIFLAKKCQ